MADNVIGIELELEGFKKFIQNFIEVNKQVLAMGDSLGDAIGDFDTFSKKLQEAGVDVSALNLDSLANSLNLIDQRLAPTNKTLQDTVDVFDKVSGAGKGTQEALKDISESTPQQNNLASFADSIGKFAESYGDLGKKVKEYGEVGDRLKELFVAFAVADAKKIGALGAASQNIDLFITAVNKLKISKAAAANLGTLGKSLDKLSDVRYANLNKILGLGDNLTTFVESVKGLSANRITNLTNLADALVTFSKADFSARIGTQLKSLAQGLTDLGNIDDGRVNSTLKLIENFTKIGSNLLQPIASGLRGVNVPASDLIDVLEAVTTSIGSFTRSLRNLEKIGEGTNLDASLNILEEGLGKLIGIINKLELAGLRNGLAKSSRAIEAFANALRSVTRSTILKNFSDNIDEIVKGLNILIRDVDIAGFTAKYSQFTDQIKDLADALRLLAKFGKTSFNDLAKAQAEQAKQETLLLRQSIKMEQASNQRTKAIEKQAKINREFLVKSFQESNSAILKFIGNLRDAEDKATLRVRIQVFGIKQLAELGELLVKLPFIAAGKSIKFLANQILSLGIALTKLSFNVLVGGLKSLLGLFKPVINGFASLLSYVTRSAVAVAQLPFKTVVAGFKAIGNIIRGTLTFFAKLLVGVIKLVYNMAAFAGKVIVVGAALKILLAPLRIITGLVNALVGAFQNLFSVFSRNNTKKTSQEFRELDAASRQAADGQQELQIEFSETDRELQKSIRNTERANAAFAGLGTTASGLRIAQAFVTGNAILKLIKQITTLTLAFKGVQIAGQLLNRALVSIRFGVQNIVGSAFEAAASYEALELSLISLQAREAFLAGEFESVQAALAATTTTLGETNSKFLEANGVAEQYGNGLTVMEQRAQGLIKELRILAIQSPLNIEDVAAANRLAQAYGFTTEESLRLTKAVVNFTAATGQSGDVAEGIIRALGQIRANGKLAKEELNQLAERGFGAVQALADSAGVSTQEFLEALSGGGKSQKTELDADGNVIDRSTQEGANSRAAQVITTTKEGGIEAEAAIEALVQTLERDFAGAALAATNTLGGMKATIQDLKTEVLRLTFTPLFDSLKPLVQQFLTLENLEVIYDRAAQAGERLRDVVQELVLRFVAAGGVIKGLFDAIPDSIKVNIKEFAKFLAIATGVTFAMTALKLALGAVIVSLGLLLNPLSLAIAAFFTFRGAIKRALEDSESLLSRFIGAIRGFVQSVSDSIGEVVGVFEPTFNAIGERIDRFATNMYTWGSATVIQFAEGMIDGIAAIASVIGQITKTISYWFKPQSPPRVAPDIDTWGEETGAEWLEGFTRSDFQNIGDFTGTVRDLADALELPEGTIDFNDLANDFAQYTAALKSGVSETEALEGLMRSVQKETGDFSDSFAQVATEYAKLAVQEQKLVDLQKEYNQTLNATDRELQKLTGAEQYLDQENALKNVQRVLNNVFATEEQKERARIEEAKIYAQRKKDDIEAQKDEIDAQKDNIDLLKERIGLDKEFSESDSGLLGDSSGAGAEKALKGIQDKAIKLQETLGGLSLEDIDLGDGLGETLETLPQNFGDFVSSFEEGKAKIQKRVDELRERFQGLIQPLIDARDRVAKLGIAITALLVAPSIIKGLLAMAGAIKAIVTALLPIVGTGLAGAAGLAVVAGIFILMGGEINAETLNNIATSITNMGVAISSFLKSVNAGFTGEEGSQFASLTEAIASLGVIDATQFAQNLGASLAGIKGEISKVVDENIVQPFKSVFASDAAAFDETGESSGLATNVLNGIVASLTTVVSQLGPKVLPFLINIYTDIAQGIVLQFQQNQDAIQQLGTAIIDLITGGITAAVGLLRETGQNVIQTELAQIFIEAFNNTDVSGEINAFGTRVVEGIKAVFANFNLAELLFPEEFSQAVENFNELGVAVSNFQIILQGIANTNFGGALIERFQALGETIKSSLPQEALNVINFFFERFRENLESTELGEKVANLAVQLSELGKTLAIVAGAIGGGILLVLGGIFAELPVILGGIIDTISGAAQIINGLVDVIIAIFRGEGIKEALDNLLTGFRTFRDGLGNIFEGLINAVTNAIVGIAIALGFDVMEPLLERFRQGANIIGAIVGEIVAVWLLGQVRLIGIFGKIGQGLTKFGAAIAKGFSNFKKLATPFLTAVRGIITTLGRMRTMFAVVPIGLGSFSDKFSSLQLSGEKFTTLQTIIEGIKTLVETLFTPFQNFADDMTALTFIDPFLPIKLGIEGVQTILGLFGIDISEFATTLTETIFANPFDTIYTAITDTQALIEPFESAFSGLQEFFSNLDLPNPLKGITESFNNLIGKDEAKEAAEGVNDAIVDGLGDSTIEVNPKLDATKAVEAAEATGGNIGGGITKGVDDAITDDTAEKSGNKLVNGWKKFWGIQSPSTLAAEEIGAPVAEGIIEGIETGLTAEEDSFTNIAQALVSGIQNAITTALTGEGEESTNLVSALFTVDEESVTGLTTQFSTLFEALIKLLEEFIEEFMDTFEEFIEEFMDFLVETTEDVLKLMSDTFAEIIKMFVSFIASFIQLLLQFLASVERLMDRLKDIFIDAAREAIKGFIEEMEKLEDEIDRVISEIITNLSDGDGNLIDRMSEFGEALGDALVAGLVDALTSEANLASVDQAAGDLADAANSAVEEETGIESPSKVWRKFGDYLVQGLALGLKENASKVIDTAVSMAENVNSAAREQLMNTSFSLSDESFGNNRSGILAMQDAAGTTIINNNNYTMNLTVRESTATQVQRNFAKMQTLRA